MLLNGINQVAVLSNDTDPLPGSIVRLSFIDIGPNRSRSVLRRVSWIT